MSDDKLRQTQLGPGVFARFYPLKFLFVNAQTELNFITSKIVSPNAPTYKEKTSAASLLLGIGYAGGRQGVGNLFYYISINGDFSGNTKSPYVGISESGKASASLVFVAMVLSISVRCSLIRALNSTVLLRSSSLDKD